MLVLTRRIGESIVLPGLDVEITIVRLQGNSVRIGITAPREVDIHRGEVWERIQSEWAHAVSAVGTSWQGDQPRADGIDRPR